jgi:hypothetical protein
MTEREVAKSELRCMPTYAELEAMYFAQCRCTDEWAAKYRAEVERKCDSALLARISELEQSLAQVNYRLSLAQQNNTKGE